MSNTLGSPFGLTFTPTTVIASRFNASGSIELIKHPLGSEYQELYRDAVQDFDAQTRKSCDLSSAPVFHDAVVPVTESLSRHLGYPPEYLALFVPSVFHPRVRDAAMEGVLTEDWLDKAFRAGWSREAACPGYKFLEGKNLGRAPEECVEDGPLNLVIVLEYEKDYLYAWLMEVEFELGTYPPIYSKYCRECGEKVQKTIGMQAYRERLNMFLSNFVEEALEKHQFDVPRESVRSIVLSGEVSTPWTTELGEMARRAVGTEVVTVMTEIDPSEVVAHGAAVWARQVKQSPRRFQIATGNKGGEPSHDEL